MTRRPILMVLPGPFSRSAFWQGARSRWFYRGLFQEVLA
jgi:hypothetical protein